MTSILAAILKLMILQEIFLSHRALSDLAIQAVPEEITLGLSDSLDVSCTVSVSELPDVAALISLTVSRDNSSQIGRLNLASINDFSNGQINLLTIENITASGWFNSSGSTSINLHWENPQKEQAGTYTCLAQSLDSLGQNLDMISTAQVTAQSPDLDFWQDMMKTMDTRLNELDNQVQKLQQENLQMSSYIKDNIMDSCNCTNSLEVEDKVSWLDETISAIETQRQSAIEEMFETPFTFNNTNYYISRDGFYHIAVSSAICKIYGGYLAEINDQAEYSAIQTFLSTTTGISGVFISGTDETAEGNWTLLATEEPLPFVDWGPSEPSGGESDNCLVLWYSIWRMFDYPCHRETPESTERFLCEVKLM